MLTNFFLFGELASSSSTPTNSRPNKKRCLFKSCDSVVKIETNCKYIRFPAIGTAKYSEWISALGLDASSCRNLSGFLCENHFKREDFKFGCLQSEAVPTIGEMAKMCTTESMICCS
jgi:hypothetical protein